MTAQLSFSSSHSSRTSTSNTDCQVSNDPATGSPNPLSVCNRTEYWCDHVDDADEDGSRTVQFRYSVEYVSTVEAAHVLLYLQEMILEHVAYGLNLTECQQTVVVRQRRRSSSQLEHFGTTTTRTAWALTGLPHPSYLASPACNSTWCWGTVQGGVTVGAPRDSLDEMATVTRLSIHDVMDLLRAPGTIERVNFEGFVEPNRDSSPTWYQNRVFLGSVGASFLCLLLMSCCCIVWFCRNLRHDRKPLDSTTRNRNRQWEVLDEELPIAQRDSLALRPQCSWMIRKARSVATDRSEATVDLTNDQEGPFSLEDDASDKKEHSDSERLVGVSIVDSSSSDIQVQKAGPENIQSVETDRPCIMNDLSDYNSEVVNQWRNLHNLEAGSTETYDDEIIQVLGHLEMKQSGAANNPLPDVDSFK